jgi:imidazolonepropionase
VTFRLIQGGREDDARQGLIVAGAAEIATLAGGLRRGSTQGEVAALAAGADVGDAGSLLIAVWGERIIAVGRRDDVYRELEAAGRPLDGFTVLQLDGGTITPGLVDPHTHLLFAGTREGELVLRQHGATYLEILAAGGGILSTVEWTRRASAEALAAHGRHWLHAMLSHGTTTVEAKSGYGLNRETEVRLLEVAYELGSVGPVDVMPTYLGAHAVPAEFRGQPDPAEAYVRDVVDVQLPAIAARGRARFCDVFCEQGVFSADQARRILEAGRAVGLEPRLHADEIAPSGGAELAAEIGALSADHLATPSDAGVDALASAAEQPRAVVAVLLPTTTWFLMKEHHAPARRFIERGIPVALGTDFNPGTSPVSSLPLVMAAACLELRMTPSETLAATTVNAAHALGRGDEIGSIEPGKFADLVVWGVPTHEQIPYWPGADLVRMVIKRGRVVVDRS